MILCYVLLTAWMRHVANWGYCFPQGDRRVWSAAGAVRGEDRGGGGGACVWVGMYWGPNSGLWIETISDTPLLYSQRRSEPQWGGVQGVSRRLAGYFLTNAEQKQTYMLVTIRGFQGGNQNSITVWYKRENKRGLGGVLLGEDSANDCTRSVLLLIRSENYLVHFTGTCLFITRVCYQTF